MTVPHLRFRACCRVVTLFLLFVLSVAAGMLPAFAAPGTGGPEHKEAAQLADNIAAKLQEVARQLEELGKSEALRQLFSTGDAAELEARSAALAGEFNSALKLRLLLPGQYDVERNVRPPLGYASLDLLQQAEKSADPVLAEVHGFGGSDAHIVLVQRVEDIDYKLIGLLHLSLAPSPYLQWGGASALAGYAELNQDTGKGVLLLSKKGELGVRTGDPIKISIKGSRWHIAYWPPGKRDLLQPPQQILPGLGVSLPLIPVLLIVVITGIVILGYLVYRRKHRAPAEVDEVKTVEGEAEVVYGGAVKAIMEGKHPGLEKLVPDLPRMGQTGPVQPLSRGLTGDDITAMEKPPAAAPTSKKVPPSSPGAPVTKPGAPTVTTPGAATTQPVKKISPAPVAMAAPAAEVPSERPQETAPKAPASTPGPAAAAELVPAIIFRTYDIRGIVGKTLTANGVYDIGRAIGTEANARGLTNIAVGRDGRTSSPELEESLIKGLLATGGNVIDIGMVPTPLLYFATHHLNTASGVMITGSHNGPAYNGLKIMLGGETLSGDAIQGLRKRIETGSLTGGQGAVQAVDITADYLRRATEDMPVALGGAFRLVVDCGNGVAGMIAPQLYRALGHDVEELYCTVDGAFPNHHPDPSQPENLQALIDKVRETGADLGFAFDGDGDRLGVVDSDGNIIWPDRQLMLFARDVLGRNPGASIIYDVKCSRHIKAVIEQSGGKPVMWKTGHSLIKGKMKELDAPLAGEMSGHIFFKERWFGFDDALYAGARLLEILMQHKKKTAQVFAELPGGIATPELRIMLPEKLHAQFMQDLRGKVDFRDAEISDIDGVRVDFGNGFGLVRPSNTTPCLIARFEADDSQGLEQIQASFRELIKKVAPDLKLPF